MPTSIATPTRRTLRRRSGFRSGFTLIEVMIVILIVLALGGLVAYNLMGTKEDAENKLCKIDMNTLEQALKQFRFGSGAGFRSGLTKVSFRSASRRSRHPAFPTLRTAKTQPGSATASGVPLDGILMTDQHRT
jgi:prepilin-type N-terminal cleavage/methylation domain-containing protein